MPTVISAPSPTATVRISVGWQTTEDDMKAAASAFNEIAAVA